MKQKNLPLIFCSILCVLFILILLPNSLIKNKPTYSTSSAKSAPLKSNEPDQLNAPNAIIFHMGTIDFTLPKGNEFDEIVRLINRSLKGTKISSSGAWADFEVPKYMSGITTIEFDYSKLQTSSFEYVGIRTTPSNGKPYKIFEQLKYTKLVFPLTDSKDEGANSDPFSLSLFSYGDTSASMGINGRMGFIVYQEYPIYVTDAIKKYFSCVN